MKIVGVRTQSGMALAFVLMATGTVFSKEVPPPPSSYVHNDGVLTAAGVQKVSQELTKFEKNTGHQMVVAAFQSLDGDDLESFVNKTFKAWKVGDKKKNDGILFAMFLKDRKWRVEVGYGFEGKITDLEAGQLATSLAVPFFKKGDYDDGVMAVVRGLADKAMVVDTAASVPAATATATLTRGSGPPIWFLVIAALSVVVVGVVVFLMLGKDDSDDDDIIIKYNTKRHVTSVRNFTPPASAPPSAKRCGKHKPSDDVPAKPSYAPSVRRPYTPPSHSSGGFGGFSGGGGSSGGGGASGGW